MERVQSRTLVDESEKTKKVREKLKRRFEELDQKITSSALERKTLEIQRWIDRHAAQRVPLKNKNISLFDENKNAVQCSSKIHEMASKIQGELEKFQMSLKEKTIDVSSRL